MQHYCNLNIFLPFLSSDWSVITDAKFVHIVASDTPIHTLIHTNQYTRGYSLKMFSLFIPGWFWRFDTFEEFFQHSSFLGGWTPLWCRRWRLCIGTRTLITERPPTFGRRFIVCSWIGYHRSWNSTRNCGRSLTFGILLLQSFQNWLFFLF